MSENNSGNLIGTPSEKLIKYWHGEVKQGLDYRKKYGKPDLWTTYKDYYRSEWKKDLVPVNKIFSFGRTLVPRTYFRDPTVAITARRPEKEWHARVLEAVDNWMIRELNLKMQLKKLILDAYTSGIGCIKLGYDSEFGFIPAQAIGQDSETATAVGQKEGERIEYHLDVKRGMPWGLRIAPIDIITPWGYSEPEAFPWICHVIMRPLDDIKEDQKFKNTKDLKGGFTQDFIRDPNNQLPLPLGEGSDAKNYGKLYEIRDLKRKRIITLCEDQVLLEAEDALQIEGLPYEFYIPNPDPDHFWGLPDVKMLESQQLELNETRTQQSKHRRIATVKFLYLKGALTKEALDALLGENVGPGVEVQNAESIANAIHELQPHIPPDLAPHAMQIESDMRDSLGYSRNQSGDFVAPISPRTATEVMEVKEASEIRGDERRDIMADLLVRVVRKWNQYIFKYWTGERIQSIVGPDGAKYWVKYSPEELISEYDFKVDPDSGLPVTRALRHTQAEKLFMQLNGDPYVDQILLRKLYLRQYEWIDPSYSMLVNPQSQQIPPEVLAKAGGGKAPAQLPSGVAQPGGQLARGGGANVPAGAVTSLADLAKRGR